jgi:hypothetical protein
MDAVADAAVVVLVLAEVEAKKEVVDVVMDVIAGFAEDEVRERDK